MVRILLLCILPVLVLGCGDAEPGNAEPGMTPDDASQDTPSGEAPDQDGLPAPTVILPEAGAELLYSAAMRIAPPEGTARVEVSAPGGTCSAFAPAYECLLDLTAEPEGPVTLTILALDAEGSELSRGEHAVARREIAVPCSGNTAERNACLIARTSAGESAGFTGVSYLNADDGHAVVGTKGMTGIDARVLDNVPSTAPQGVDMGVVNESRAWLMNGGRCSIPRCYGRRAWALKLYEQGIFAFWPEHRDHGKRDYFQWQAPFFGLSQGSSGSEKDEVVKLLQALAAFSPAARSAAKDSALLGPIMSFLLVRSRVESDVAYLTPAAHPTALANAPSSERILTLAAAMTATELPPVAKLTVESADLPEPWSMSQVMNSVYAVGYAPNDGGTSKEGRFSIVVDLSASHDAAGRPLMFFPAILRGSPDDVLVERANAEGTLWTVSGSHPADFMLLTEKHERIVSRTTVAFFPHNGLWLGAPAMLSVGAQAPETPAPDANNLD